MGFLDGSRLYDVRAYTSARELWREWGRSIDLTDSTSTARQLGDVVFLLLVQGIPLLALLVLGALALAGHELGTGARALATVSGILVGVRLLLQRALASSYARTGAPFWLSPLADPLAALRILLGTVRRPTEWRGRSYAAS